MPRLFAQYADAGKYLLETAHLKEQDNPWAWSVVRSSTRETVFSGRAKTLDDAKRLATARVGIMAANWKDIGPAIDLPD